MLHYLLKNLKLVLAFVGAFAKLRKATVSYVMSVLSKCLCSYPRGKTRLPLDGFS